VSRLTAEQARLFEDLNLPKPPAKAM